jgi:hypothetical protein
MQVLRCINGQLLDINAFIRLIIAEIVHALRRLLRLELVIVRKIHVVIVKVVHVIILKRYMCWVCDFWRVDHCWGLLSRLNLRLWIVVLELVIHILDIFINVVIRFL